MGVVVSRTSPSDYEVEQLVLCCINICDSHEIRPGMSDNDDISRNLQAPATVEAVVRGEAVRVSASKDRVVVLKPVVWM